MAHWNTESHLLQNLSNCGLLCPQSLTGGELAVYDFSSRNRNLLIEQEQPLFIKIGLDEHRKDALRMEASVYNDPKFGQSKDGSWRFLPSLKYFDSKEGVLITEGWMKTVSLAEVLLQPEAHDLKKAGERVGEALASIAQSPFMGEETDHYDYAPWAFTLGLPTKESYMHFSSGAQEIIQLTQRNENYTQHLEQLRQGWKCNGIIHNDFKPDNLLFTQNAEEQLDQPKVIDWEMCGWGDVRWDVGTLWAAVLKVWIDAVEKPGEPDMKPTKKVNELFDFNRSFWHAYASHLPAHERLDALVATVQYAGVGLLKTAVEITEMMSTPKRTHLLYLQVSHNLIVQPMQAARTLLGLQQP